MRPASYLFLFIFSSCVYLSSTANFSPTDAAALQIIADRFPDLNGLSDASWTDLANACNGSTSPPTSQIIGVQCTEVSGVVYVSTITITSVWGAENLTSPLQPLGSYFSANFVMFTVHDMNISVDFQTAIYTQNLQTLKYYNSLISSLGDFTQLSNLQSLILSGLSHLNTLPSLATLPVDYLSLTQVNITVLPSLPSALQRLYLLNCPYLDTLPTNLTSLPLNTLSMTACPVPIATIPAPNLATIFVLYINSNLYTDYPSWFCTLNGALTLFQFRIVGTQLPPVPVCVGNFNNLQRFEVNSVGGFVTYPPGLFQLPNLISLSLNTNVNFTSDLLSTPWNLPSLMNLVMPGSMVAQFVPPLGSLLGAHYGFSPSLLTAVSGRIPDQYFTSFANATSITWSNQLIEGPFPSSISSLVSLQTLHLSYNALNGTIPPALFLLPNLYRLLLTDNPLTGALPATLGTLPAATSSNAPYMYLDKLNVDLCVPATFSSAFNSSNCLVGGYCLTCVPNVTNCVALCLPPPPPTEPTSPTTPPNGLVPAAVPSSTLSPAPNPASAPSSNNTCYGYQIPSAGSWLCLPSTGWVSNATIITVDPFESVSNITIVGNLTAPVLTFGGLNTSIAASGCISTSSLHVNLTSEDISLLKSLSGMSSNRTLLLQNGSDCGSINNLPVTASILDSSDSCDQVSTSYSSDDPHTLSVVFQVTTSSSCGKKSGVAWFIILVSVLGGVIVLVATFVLLVTFVAPVSRLFRPFARLTPLEEAKAERSSQAKRKRTRSRSVQNSAMYEPASGRSGTNKMYEA